jgi:hypothetical protein
MRRAGPTLLVCAAIAAAPFGACGDDDDDTSADSPTEPATTETTTTAGEDREDDEGGADEPEQEPEHAEEDEEPRLSPDERAAARAVRGYIRGLAQRDGAAVCASLAPGAIDEVKLPENRGSCAASLEASIGYRDPRGLPVWETARVAELQSAEVSGASAKVVVTTVTEFADREEPSIEDDVVYLVSSGGDWLIAKPSSTLYRSVGIAEVPPSVLAPP